MIHFPSLLYIARLVRLLRGRYCHLVNFSMWFVFLGTQNVTNTTTVIAFTRIKLMLFEHSQSRCRKVVTRLLRHCSKS